VNILMKLILHIHQYRGWGYGYGPHPVIIISKLLTWQQSLPYYST